MPSILTRPSGGGGGSSSLFLDQWPDADLLLSCYKQKASLNKNCMRVRRSSDNAESDIGYSGSSIDVDALETFVGAGNNGFVVAWYDQVRENIAYQFTSGSQPKIVSSGSIITKDGYYCVDFDGGDWLTMFYQGSIKSAYVVASADNHTAKAINSVLAMNNSNSYDFFYGGSAAAGISVLSSGGGMGTTTKDSNIHLATMYTSEGGSTRGLYIDDDADSSTGNPAIANFQFNTIGRRNGNSALSLDGKVFQIITFTSDEYSNKSDHQDYLNTQFGL